MGKKKLGLIVNPVAGMGGRVGLKGSDGEAILRRAIELGAVPQSPGRAIQALERIAAIKDEIDLLTCPQEMGENEAIKSGFLPIVIGSGTKGQTTPEDTIRAAKQMKELEVDLILFAGGDGTARNIYHAVGDKQIVLGIPAGVKIHSAVYGQNPNSSGELARLYLQGKVKELHEAEVMDIDEEAFRAGRVSAKLYGYLKVPYEKRYVQNLKSGGVAGEQAALEAIANYVVDQMEEDFIYIIGPGTTTRVIMDKLGLKNTLLGVDAICNRQLVANDVNESQLLHLLEGRKAKIVVTTIGGQGYIFGRGNQQLSPAVISKVGKENIIIVSTRDKLNSIFGNPLLVDTGDEAVNAMLNGYFRVIVGYDEAIMQRVAS